MESCRRTDGSACRFDSVVFAYLDSKSERIVAGMRARSRMQSIVLNAGVRMRSPDRELPKSSQPFPAKRHQAT